MCAPYSASLWITSEVDRVEAEVDAVADTACATVLSVVGIEATAAPTEAVAVGAMVTDWDREMFESCARLW